MSQPLLGTQCAMLPPGLPEPPSRELLSDELRTALAQSAAFTQWLADRKPSTILETREGILAGTSYAVCLDHRDAVLLLVWRDFRSSAFALWRSVYEALMRGYWAEACAGEKEFRQIEATRELPSFDAVIRALDKQDVLSAYGKSKAKLWKPMSHFAHGGVVQLANWFGPEGVAARHSDAHAARLLASVDVYALLACAGANRLARLEPFDESEFDAKLDELLARFPSDS